jgi:cell division protein FtsQ
MKAPASSLKRPLPSIAGARAALAPSPRLRRRVLSVAVVAALLAALYSFWLRDSSLVAVDRVAVTGVTSRDAERVRSALTSTARTMTTLHVDRERLEDSVSVFPVVQSIEVETDFPHGLTVRVIEHRPAALLDTDGRTVPVAGDGTVLVGLPVEGDLPTIELSGPAPQRELPPGGARDAAAVAGAAPPAIARRVESIGREGGTRGVVARIADGPEIVFGDAHDAAAKWAGAVRVLADSEAAGATYVDVRIPERPVAGGLAATTVAPVAPVGETPTEPVIPPADPATASPTDPSLAPPGTVSPTAPVEPTTPVVPADPTAGGGVAP